MLLQGEMIDIFVLLGANIKTLVYQFVEFIGIIFRKEWFTRCLIYESCKIIIRMEVPTQIQIYNHILQKGYHILNVLHFQILNHAKEYLLPSRNGIAYLGGCVNNAYFKRRNWQVKCLISSASQVISRPRVMVSRRSNTFFKAAAITSMWLLV